MDLETLRAFCLKLPAAKEDVKWGSDLTFIVGEKMFCVTEFKNPPSISIKADEKEFEDLVELPGITPAPYLARYKWVNITNTDDLPRKEVERLVRTSYEIVKSKLPKKVLREIGLGVGSSRKRASAKRPR